MDIDFVTIIDGLISGIKFIPVTLELSVIPMAAGLLFGTLMALAQFYKIPVLSQMSRFFVTLESGIPSLVTLLILNVFFLTCFDSIAGFFGSSLTIRDVNPIFIGILAFSIFHSTNECESVRSVLLSIDRGQFEAGYSVGLTTPQILMRVVFPQCVPAFIPVFTNNMVGAVKNTAVVLSVGILDILSGCQIPAQTNYRYLECYISAAILYWILNGLIEAGLTLAEKHSGKFRPQRNAF